MCIPFRGWYDELQKPSPTSVQKGVPEREQDRREVACIASGVEIFMFYFSLIVLLVFGSLVICPKIGYKPEYLSLLSPLFIWMFLRSSRKDMNATATLVGAIFGVTIAILTKIFIK